MIENTINDDRTVAGGDKDMILSGRYHILRQLGQGGMGAVWLAEDRQLDNRKVAIKMLPSIIMTDKRAYNQLKSEALVSLKLIHPNIVTLRAFEENDGAPFLVMDYIDGRPLSDYLAVKGKLSEAETIKLLKPIAEALDYAHGEKVIHRDVKPSNIIIRKDGHPFILDFGIAREIQESMTRVTGGTVSGTLLYMSPEQVRGAPPAPAQDVYSFAAMVYECLNGDPPFIRGEIPYQIINENPMPLAGTPQLVASVMAGLAKKPENRPNKCAAVLGEECPSQGRVCEKVRSKVNLVKNESQKEQKSISEDTELSGEKQIARESHGGLAESRNWKIAPASIKSVLILLSFLILGLLTLLAVTTNAKTDVVIIPIVLGVCILIAFWACHIWKGRNWTRIFALAILCSCFISAIKEVVIHGADFSSNIAAISFCLVIVALLFCPGSNKWFGAWPRGWSYWPLLLVLPLIVLCFDGDEELTRSKVDITRQVNSESQPINRSQHKSVKHVEQNIQGPESHKNENLRNLSNSEIDAEIAKLGTQINDTTQKFLAAYKEKKYDVAAKLMKDVDRDNAEVQFALGIMYTIGQGVAQDDTESFKWFRNAAEQGNTSAQYIIGLMYKNGKGIVRDDTEAFKWCLKAAEGGILDAQNVIGDMFAAGKGVTKDEVEAVKWYRKAAEQGSAHAQKNLGLMYENGQGVAEDAVESARWYRKAAEQGVAFAQYRLGAMYSDGNGIEKNVAEAVKWYRKAAEQNLAIAQFCLGVMYENGSGVIKNEEEALKWYVKSVEHGFELAQESIGRLKAKNEKHERNAEHKAEMLKRFLNLCKEKKYDDAAKLINSIDRDDADVQYNIGNVYRIGKHYWDDALKWYRKAAEQGHVKAQYSLGDMYESAKNEIGAFHWYCKAAEQGDSAAQRQVGVMYALGKGVKNNECEAVRWYRKAAEQGDCRAQAELGGMYESGRGVVQDKVEALKWYRKAADQGDIVAKSSVERIQKSLETDISSARSAMDLKNWETAYKKYSLAFKYLDVRYVSLRKECAQGMAEARYQAGRQAFRDGNFDRALEHALDARKLKHPRAQALIEAIVSETGKKAGVSMPKTGINQSQKRTGGMLQSKRR